KGLDVAERGRFQVFDAADVGELKLAWYVDLGAGERGQESTPLIVDGAMYVTTSWSRVIALEAGTGKVLWRYDPKVPGDWGVNACCDVVNRGAALWEGKVYVGTLEGRLVALDAKNGQLLWQTPVIDRAERASITGAPRVIKGRVFIGSAGGEFGIRGRLTAVDAATGAILWRFFTVPGNPAVQPENLHLPAAAQTWTGQWWTRGGGGTVWDAMSYDPALDLLYIGTGNGSPWPQSVRSPKGGDNLFVSSILALRAETGEVVWHYQTTPGDEWGFDAASQMVLAEMFIAGNLRSVLIQAAANGFIYVIDRATGVLLSATPYVPTTWAASVDMATGRPLENPGARYSKTLKPFTAKPGPKGAHSWHPMAFNPRNGFLYIPAMLNSAELAVSKLQPVGRYALSTGTDVSHEPGTPPDSSRLIAWDPAKGKVVWSVDHETPVASGVLSTAGSVVFQGSTQGTLEAFQADTGKSLWRTDTGASITAAPVTYEVNGTQMVAVVAGSGGATLLEGGVETAKYVPATNTRRLLAYSLKGTAQLPIAPTSALQPSPPARFGTPAQVAKGKALYAEYCARCHGGDTINAGPLKDLKHSSRLGDSKQWGLVVHAGLLGASGMPGFMAELNAADADSIRAYVIDRAVAIP
ncbi:MAG: PQQ-dependent dehydrogenase, methanol/ethanol family, partial [Pseudomonadota bacterium]